MKTPQITSPSESSKQDKRPSLPLCCQRLTKTGSIQYTWWLNANHVDSGNENSPHCVSDSKSRNKLPFALTVFAATKNTDAGFLRWVSYNLYKQG
jgi:hypothetical protein